MPEQRLAFDSVYFPDLTVGQYRNLLDLAQLAVGHPTTEALFPTLALRLQHAFSFGVLTLGLYNSRTESIRLNIWKAGEELSRSESLPFNSCASGWAWKTQRSVIVQDLATEPKLPAFLESLRLRHQGSDQNSKILTCGIAQVGTKLSRKWLGIAHLYKKCYDR